MSLPYALDLTNKELKSIFDQGDLDNYSIGYLKEMGYYDPSIWGVAIKLGSTGSIVWIPQDTTGRVPVVEENSGTINTNVGYLYGHALQDMYPTVNGALVTASSTQMTRLRRKLLVAEITLDGAGQASNQVISVAESSYYDFVEFIGLISDFTQAGVDLDFEDEDDTALTGLMGGKCLIDFVANEFNTQIAGASVYTTTDNKDLEVDIGDVQPGGAAGKISIYMIGHKET